MESKYNLLTRLLKNIKNVVNPDGSVAGSGGVMIVHEVEHRDQVFLDGTLPNVDGYAFRISGDKEITAYYLDISVDLDDVDIESICISIGDTIYHGFSQAVTYTSGTLTIRVGGRNYGYTSESELQGLNIAVYTLSIVLDKTYKEIADAGFAVLHDVVKGTLVHPLAGFGSSVGGYIVSFMDRDMGSYIASTENDYPVFVPEASAGGDSEHTTQLDPIEAGGPK